LRPGFGENGMMAYLHCRGGGIKAGDGRDLNGMMDREKAVLGLFKPYRYLPQAFLDGLFAAGDKSSMDRTSNRSRIAFARRSRDTPCIARRESCTT
jgi:hypothetical protein